MNGSEQKQGLSHIYMKNELDPFLRVFLLENLLMDLLTMLQFLCTHWLCQIYTLFLY